MYGWMENAPLWLNASAILLLTSVLAFYVESFLIWTVAAGLICWSLPVPTIISAPVLLGMVLLNITVLRRYLVSAPMMNLLRILKLMPKISQTEITALEAGTTWIDGELFSGNPNHARILAETYPGLTPEEQAFIDGPVDRICQMTNDWQAFSANDLPKEVWDYLKQERFFGMIVPKEYGGHGFSARCNSEVVQKLGSRSIPLCVAVMVPNSLGPAELLNHYGTKEQKDYYLPRLADGREIPCFALTEPDAGSDAGSMTSWGEVFQSDDGKLYIRLNWDKRYITLAAISTLIGLAVKIKDPKNLLGKGKEVGITCILVPSDSKGVVLGLRHSPMGVPFYNCPTSGHDVVVSVDQIIGGPERAGDGWKMLMESLAAGRSISLPAQSVGGMKLTARSVSAYCSLRKQFGVPIASFEGVEERLAEIYGKLYMTEALRIYTAGAVDSGMKPSVVSAIAKYIATELGRDVIIAGMDVVGGAGISRGPKNLLANIYIGLPISITVEGANILTRSMIIFGQGALRCHPFAYKEFKALSEGDLVGFDRAFFGHVGFVIRNVIRATVLSATRGRFVSAPKGPFRRYYQKLTWSSACFAVLTDVAMGSLAGALKFREKVTGRFADILIHMYLATAVLRRFEAEGVRQDDLPFVQWSMRYCFDQIQQGFDGLLVNFPVPGLKFVFSRFVSQWSRMNSLCEAPSDDQGAEMVKSFSENVELRERHTEGMFLPTLASEALAEHERAFSLQREAAPIEKRLRRARKSLSVKKGEKNESIYQRALEKNVITASELAVLQDLTQLRNRVIAVDSFSLDGYVSGFPESKPTVRPMKAV